jgi:nucleoside-diphosphate-sugar epimerase
LHFIKTKLFPFMNTLIAGCGYIGLSLGKLLRGLGHPVTGWVYSEKSAQGLREAGLEVIQADLVQGAAWKHLSRSFDAIVYCPSTRGGQAEDYQRIYVEGMKQARQALKSGGRFIYTASTSVYGQADGSLVDESSMTEPSSATGKILLEAESVARSVQGTVLRLSAIYGPGRAMMLKRFFDVSGVVPGEADRYLNQIHREDAVSAMAFVLKESCTRDEIYNVSDDHAATHGEIYQWLAQMTGRSQPVFQALTRPRKRGESNRRISNAKLRGLGWELSFPSYREGYGDLLSAEH